MSLSSLARASWVHMLFAFLAMGGWAMFANPGHPPPEALRAGLVQGLLSAGLTFGIKRGLEAMHRRMRGAAAMFAPPSISCITVLVLLLGAHTLAGTPEIWATIAVPFAVSSTYAFVYIAGLELRARRARAA